MSDRLDQPFEDRTLSSKKNSESLLKDSYKKETNLNKPLEYMSNADVNPNVIKDILLDIPIKIMEQSRELGNFYEDFGDDRYNYFKLCYIHIITDKIYISKFQKVREVARLLLINLMLICRNRNIILNL